MVLQYYLHNLEVYNKCGYAQSVPYTPSTLIKNPVSGSLVVPLISPSVGVTVKENLSHTLRLEYMKMYSLASPHTETESVSVESRVVLVMSTQYSMRGRAFYVMIMVFGATIR